jgi:hypothetical protein
MYSHIVNYLDQLSEDEKAFAQQHLAMTCERSRILPRLIELVENMSLLEINRMLEAGYPHLGGQLHTGGFSDLTEVDCRKELIRRLNDASLATLRRVLPPARQSDEKKKQTASYRNMIATLEKKILTFSVKELNEIVDIGEGELGGRVQTGGPMNRDIDSLRQLVLERVLATTLSIQEQIYSVVCSKQAINTPMI